jgi:hypothetical protein
MVLLIFSYFLPGAGLTGGVFGRAERKEKKQSKNKSKKRKESEE